MKQLFIWLLTLALPYWYFDAVPVHAQTENTNPTQKAEKVVLSGYLKDAESGEGLIGASIYVKELKTGVVANEYGYYALNLPPGNYTLVITYTGYTTRTEKIALTQKITQNFELKQVTVQLEEVVVEGGARDNVESMEMSVNKMDISTIKKIPAVLGEVDVVRSLLFLPGVSTVGEGATGFNVRGGSVDHNLVLQDGAPVYNSSHLFGFFSVFNPDAVKDVKLYKGGIPAQYGGRLASVLDVRLKEGNNRKFTGEGGVGTIFSRLMLEGPIRKDRSSFIIAGRRTYIDALGKAAGVEQLKNNTLYFYDLTAKVNYKFNEKNSLFLSGYFGRDIFKFGTNFGFNFGNTTATLRWNHIFNERLFFNLTSFYSNYDYQLMVNAQPTSFDWRSNIINYSVQPDFTYFLNPNNTLSFGGQVIFHDFRPGSIKISSDNSIFKPFKLQDRYATEAAIYAQNEQKLNTRFSVLYGLRVSVFDYYGPGLKYHYGDAPLGEKRPVKAIDTLSWGSSVVRYPNIEPRFSVKYAVGENSSIKLSYNRMVQYLHLISNTTAATPLDVWTPSNNNIAPQIAHQVAAGYFRNFGKSATEYETSAEVYYKYMLNQIDYIDGANLLLNEFLDGELLSGIGRAYGLELYARKNSGKLNGFVSYTLAKSERLVKGINNNEWYDNRFDQRHNLKVVAMYQLNKRWGFNSTFTLLSGTPATFPDARFQYESYAVPNLSTDARNNARIPTYHRVDLGITLDAKNKELRKWKGQWVFSIYNLYSRRNPFSVYFQGKDFDTPTEPSLVTQAIRFSVFGSIVPAVTYNFSF